MSATPGKFPSPAVQNRVSRHSFAYPFLSLAYVAVAVFAYFVFREDLNAWRVAGIGFICVGTILIAQGGSGHEEAGDLSKPVQTSELAQ